MKSTKDSIKKKIEENEEAIKGKLEFNKLMRLPDPNSNAFNAVKYAQTIQLQKSIMAVNYKLRITLKEEYYEETGEHYTTLKELEELSNRVRDDTTYYPIDDPRGHCFLSVSQPIYDQNQYCVKTCRRNVYKLTEKSFKKAIDQLEDHLQDLVK